MKSDVTATLRPLAPAIWAIEQPDFSTAGLVLGLRSMLVRLAGGGLWLHAPGPAIAALRFQIEALGPVVALVAPNLLHYRSVEAARAVFPEARVFGAPGLRKKRPRLAIDEDLGQGDEPPALWAADIDQHAVAGAPRLGEVTFFHRESRTLMLTDLALNVPRSSHWFTRFVMRLNSGTDRFGATRIVRAHLKDEKAVARSLNRMLEWDFHRITVAHGDIVEKDARATFRAGYPFCAMGP